MHSTHSISSSSSYQTLFSNPRSQSLNLSKSRSLNRFAKVYFFRVGSYCPHSIEVLSLSVRCTQSLSLNLSIYLSIDRSRTLCSMRKILSRLFISNCRVYYFVPRRTVNEKNEEEEREREREHRSSVRRCFTTFVSFQAER